MNNPLKPTMAQQLDIVQIISFWQLSTPTAHNYHPEGYPAFTVFLSVVDSLKSGTDTCTRLV